ncbi:hypothetical protein [Sandarakinorhabdus sp. DWP1-3-1]|uniref:hypothetical protein n=1 Tax=Sandarakinorhabdus sp. DWP1-3-1 TaxID=2804627 RepID=UPI003CEFB1B0
MKVVGQVKDYMSKKMADFQGFIVLFPSEDGKVKAENVTPHDQKAPGFALLKSDVRSLMPPKWSRKTAMAARGRAKDFTIGKTVVYENVAGSAAFPIVAKSRSVTPLKAVVGVVRRFRALPLQFGDFQRQLAMVSTR